MLSRLFLRSKSVGKCSTSQSFIRTKISSYQIGTLDGLWQLWVDTEFESSREIYRNYTWQQQSLFFHTQRCCYPLTVRSGLFFFPFTFLTRPTSSKTGLLKSHLFGYIRFFKAQKAYMALACDPAGYVEYFLKFLWWTLLYITLIICNLIFFSLDEISRTWFSAVVCTSLPCLPAAGNTFEQNVLKKCWTSQFLYIRRTRILAISYAVFLYVQKRNFNLNLLEPLKD